MERLATEMGAMILGIGGIFLMVVFSTFMGGLAGYLVGLVCGDTILNVAAQVGIRNVSMFQFGVFLGFVGGFLKTKVSAVVKNPK